MKKVLGLLLVLLWSASSIAMEADGAETPGVLFSHLPSEIWQKTLGYLGDDLSADLSTVESFILRRSNWDREVLFKNPKSSLKKRFLSPRSWIGKKSEQITCKDFFSEKATAEQVELLFALQQVIQDATLIHCSRLKDRDISEKGGSPFLRGGYCSASAAVRYMESRKFKNLPKNERDLIIDEQLMQKPPIAWIETTKEQMAVFKSLPKEVQDALRLYIRRAK